MAFRSLLYLLHPTYRARANPSPLTGVISDSLLHRPTSWLGGAAKLLLNTLLTQVRGLFLSVQLESFFTARAREFLICPRRCSVQTGSLSETVLILDGNLLKS